MKKNAGSIIWGLLIIAVGVAYAGNVLDLWDVKIFFTGWWTLFIIIPCLYSMLHHGPHAANIIGLSIGAILLLQAQDVVPDNTLGKLIFPVMLVGIGVTILLGGKMHRKIASKARLGNKSEYSAVFGGQEIKMIHELLSTLELTAIFGGLSVDLSDAIISEDSVIEANAIFGGVDIIVPDYVNVKLSSTPIFGGVDCKIPQANTPDAPTLLVSGTAIFGGIDVKRVGQK